MMDRRKFIKNSCFACVALAATGTLLSSCGTMAVVTSSVQKNELRVSSTSFPENTASILVRAKELEYDILLIRLPDKEYRAIFMQCTHQDNPVVVTSTGIFCNTHGSCFDLEGRVQAGPATRNLKMYRTATEASEIIIYLS